MIAALIRGVTMSEGGAGPTMEIDFGGRRLVGYPHPDHEVPMQDVIRGLEVGHYYRLAKRVYVGGKCLMVVKDENR